MGIVSAEKPPPNGIGQMLVQTRVAIAQGVVLAFLALYVPLVGWRLQRCLGLYLMVPFM